jgi:hypothetical protein
MAQVYYVGPLAGLISEYGGDVSLLCPSAVHSFAESFFFSFADVFPLTQMGNYVGFAWAAVVFPPARWLELRRFGR